MSGNHRAKSRAPRRAAAVAAAVVGGLALIAPTASAASPDWDAVIQCESSGDFTAENASSTASGGFQITDPTWQQYGGKGTHAADASVAEQYRVAARIYADRGMQPWESSGSCHGLS